jgi:hypothetical protein
MPPALTSRQAADSAARLAAAVTASTDLAEQVAVAISASRRRVGGVDADVVGGVLTQVADSFHDVALVAMREAERRAELAALAPQVLDVEALPGDVHDLDGLLAIVASLRESG